MVRRCFAKEHLRKAGIKFPHLFLIGEAGSGKSNTLERVILPIFGEQGGGRAAGHGFYADEGRRLQQRVSPRR